MLYSDVFMSCLNFQKVDGVGDILCTYLTPNFDETLGQFYGMFHPFDNIGLYVYSPFSWSTICVTSDVLILC